MHTSNIKPSFIIIYFICFFLLSSCVSYTTDVSKNNELWGGYKYNGEYKLLSNVFLIKDSIDKYLALSPESNLYQEAGLYSPPKSIKEYIKSNGAVESLSQVEGIIYKGTKIKVISLENTTGISLWFGFVSGNTIFARIQDGEHIGKIVNIQDLSVFCKNKGTVKFKPDPRLLISITSNGDIDC